MIMYRATDRIARKYPSIKVGILDCCRMFKYVKLKATRGQFDREMANIAEAANDTIIGFACGPDQLASDGIYNGMWVHSFKRNVDTTRA